MAWGSTRFWCNCPGIDDPERVKDIMQSTAMLEIKQSLGGPYPSEQAALQDKGGVLPADAILLPGQASRGLRPRGRPGIWCRAFPRLAAKICAMRSPAAIRTDSPA